MKTFFRKIDKSTIRKNPDYDPSGIANIPLAPTANVAFMCKAPLPESLEKFLILTNIRSHYGGELSGMCMVDAITMEPPESSEEVKILYAKMRALGCENIGISIHNNNQEIHNLLRSPPYLYDYEDVEVQCKKCKKKFMSNELLEAQSDDEACEYTMEQCPKCRKWDCCEIVYEERSDEELADLMRSM